MAKAAKAEPLLQRRYIDPAELKKIEEAQKRLQRGAEILSLIELDVASIEIVDIPPLTEYQLFIRNFGNSNSTQSHTQTNEDVCFVEVQTDDIETDEKSVQVSQSVGMLNEIVQFPDDIGFSGGSSANDRDRDPLQTYNDRARLAAFLLPASEVSSPFSCFLTESNR